MVIESKGNWEAVIGLELHAQLRTESKQYCPCPVMFTNDPADANRYVCPICLGHPGVLPSLNRKSVELALRLAIAAGATVNRRNVFARKNYFYPDLPKGYQISQYEVPLAEGGELPYYTAQARAESARGGGAMIADADARMARFIRMHLEEDTAKSYHLPDGRSIVDFNRSGIPLIEIVTQPDFRNADDAIAYLEEIRLTMIYLGVSDANMELGQMRCEPNVSVRRVGEAELRTKTEIKNLNSFALLKKAVEYEIERQTHEWESSGRVLPQTMRWDDGASGFDGRSGATVAMRTKETADDYRYFDEPDLPPLIVTDAMLADAARFSYRTAFMLRQQLMDVDGLSEYDARNIVSIPSNVDWYEALIPAVADAKLTANWVLGEISRWRSELGDGFKASPQKVRRLMIAMKAGILTNVQAKTIFEKIAREGVDPTKLIAESVSASKASTADLDAIIAEVISANPAPVEDYLKGKKAAAMVLVGQVMKKTRGAADALLVQSLVEAKLESMEEN